ncbi:hypothetical protein [Candidatus Laterigemmans baculatus]|uniref:hypothetical protein n=1 Tax=Candidatus Laterigemmans baculatus TaxID=2770505 RepID=UPI0013D94BEE|nr:hypothetical protein [Candidatus Laterigemmans baculatus]
MRPQPAMATSSFPTAMLRGICGRWLATLGAFAGSLAAFGGGGVPAPAHAAEPRGDVTVTAIHCEPVPQWSAGYDFVFAQARFSDHVGLVEQEEDLLGNSQSDALRFEHDLELSPRVWIAYQTDADIGLRAAWWQLDSRAGSLAAQPAASGFGEVSHPDLADVDLSSVVPDERLTAGSALELYAIDLEVTKAARLAEWSFLFAAGLRHAAIDQQHQWTLFNAAGDLAGDASLTQRLSGLGPTISLSSTRTAFGRLRLTAGLRASLLLAESQTGLAAVEDADLATPFTTRVSDEGDDLLPILETSVRADWIGLETAYGRWLLGGGVEAQWWSGVGTASDPAADLAILGLTFGTGWEW